MRTRSNYQAPPPPPPTSAAAPPISAAESRYLSSLPSRQLPFESVASIQQLEGNQVIQGQMQKSPYNSIFPDPRIDDLSEAESMLGSMIPEQYNEEQLNNLLTVAEISSKKQNMSIYEMIYLTDLKLRLIHIQHNRKEDFQPETMLRVNYIIALIGMVLKNNNIQGGKQLLSRNSRRAKKNKTNKKKKKKSVNNKKRSGKKI